WGHSTWKLDSGGFDHNEHRQKRLAKEVEAAFPDVAELVRFLSERLIDLNRYCEESLQSAQLLVNRLMDSQITLAREIFDASQRNPQSPLAGYCSFALSALLRQAPSEAHERIGELIAHDEVHLPFVASAYSKGALVGRQLNDDDRGIIRQVFRSDDASVLGCTLWIFREVAERDKQFAIELLANANPALAHASKGKIFRWLDGDKLIPFDSISDEDLERIIQQLFITPDRLDEYFMREFLMRTARRNPRQVLELVKSRLDRAIAEDDWNYSPIGGLDNAAQSLNFLQYPEGATMFRETLDWALPKATGYKFSYRFADLVAGVFGFAEPVFTSTLEFWSVGGNDRHFAVLAAVLREAPNQFVFSEHAFVVRILRTARCVGKSACRAVSSSLFSSAISGGRSGTPGEPYPADVDMKTCAEQVLGSLSKGDPAYALYDDMRRYAEDGIERALAEGRAMDEEDADA
ncbi:MAG: hypothetical protein P8Y42_15085, partial [Exilibacterium sp.]